MSKVKWIGVALAVLLVVIVAAVLLGGGEKQEPVAQPSPASQQEQLKTQARSPEKDGELDQRDNLRETDKRKEQVEDKAAKLPVVPKARRIIGGAQTVNCPASYIRTSPVRSASRIKMDVLHFTVSPNRPGKSDILGIRNYFRSVSADSTYLVDFEANCLQIKPWSATPWTQGNFNSVSRSYEIIATGRESRAQWLASPLIRTGALAELVRDNMRRSGLPLRRVNPNGCTPLAGVTDHNSLECGNSHTDVAPAFPWDVFMRQLTGSGPSATPVKVTTWCRKLNWFRTEVRKNHTLPPGAGAEAAKRKDLILKAKFVCLGKGPVPR